MSYQMTAERQEMYHRALVPFCYYVSMRRGEWHYIACFTCNVVHGLCDSKTGHLVWFARRADAQRLCKLLNSQETIKLAV